MSSHEDCLVNMQLCKNEFKFATIHDCGTQSAVSVQPKILALHVYRRWEILTNALYFLT